MKGLMFILLLASQLCYGQRIFVGESQPKKEEAEFLTIEKIKHQNIRIKETGYKIFFDKEEVTESLKGDLENLDKDYQKLFTRVIE